jgi:hypothetical protein
MTFNRARTARPLLNSAGATITVMGLLKIILVMLVMAFTAVTTATLDLFHVSTVTESRSAASTSISSFVVPSNSATMTPAAPSSVAASTAPTQNPKTSEIYTNQYYGFSLVYPSDWTWAADGNGKLGEVWEIQFFGTTSNHAGITDYLSLTINDGTENTLDEQLVLNKRPVVIDGINGWSGTFAQPYDQYEQEIIFQYGHHVYHISIPLNSAAPKRILSTLHIVPISLAK